MRNYTAELIGADSQFIGPALMEAKQTYYQQGQNLNVYDEKILIESTLYGLPQYVLHTGAVANSSSPVDAFPSVMITTSLPAGLGGLQSGYVEIGLLAAFNAFW